MYIEMIVENSSLVTNGEILLKNGVVENIITTMLRDTDDNFKVYVEVAGKIIADDIIKDSDSNKEKSKKGNHNLVAQASREASSRLFKLAKHSRGAYFEATIIEGENLGDTSNTENTSEYVVTKFPKAFILDYEENLDESNGIGTFSLKFTNSAEHSSTPTYEMFDNLAQLKSSEIEDIYLRLTQYEDRTNPVQSDSTQQSENDSNKDNSSNDNNNRESERYRSN